MNNINTNSIILRILKRSMRINKYFHFLSYDKIVNVNDLYTQYIDEDGFEFNFEVSNVKVEEHAVLRWNSRIGPNLTQKELESLFYKLVNMPYRIRKIKKGFGILDSDIIFTFKESDGEMIITTFYGRCSLNHTLNQIEALRGYNAFQNEQIFLNIDKDTLSKQVIPYVPMVYMEFSGVKTNYYLEGYKLVGQEHPIFIVRCVPGETVIINLNKRTNKRINKSILMALFRMGYRDYVWDYLQEHYQDRVVKLMNR